MHQRQTVRGKQNGHLVYQEFLSRFQELVRQGVPHDATVIVVSKGDAELLKLGCRRAWHFPQRGDGVYAGYYPSDSAAAITHLEALRKKGGEFLLIPAPAFWWLDHYDAFRRHLESNYQIVLRDEKTCLVFGLNRAPSVPPEVAEERELSDGDTGKASSMAKRNFDEHLMADLEALFDLDYYTEQAGAFPSNEAALADYLTVGFAKGHSPNRLFDPAYYESQILGARAAGENPLVHFLTHSVSELQNPNPYFDTEFYYSQEPSLRAHGINALVHYVSYAGRGCAHPPNPLFDDAYYLNCNPGVKLAGLNPLAHFIFDGCSEGRSGSRAHQNMVGALLGASKEHLLRGNWRNGIVLFFVEATNRTETLKALAVAENLGKAYHLKCPLLLSTRAHLSFGEDANDNLLVLEDFQLACDVSRPSALRLLVKSLAAMKPLFAVTDSPATIETLHAEGLRPILISDGEGEDHFPAGVMFHPYGESSIFDYVASLMALAKGAFQVPESIYLAEQRRAAAATRKVIIPCCDWYLSGVNSALEAIGKELVRLGWDVEIVFTRGADKIAQTASDAAHLPEIPYRYLEQTTLDVGGMWEALLAYLETNAPCIMLMAYDFVANSIAPALSEKVGVVLWAQSDDKDYYEQVYRLGRYCNAVVCVSEHIRNGVMELNPLIGARSQVIHNASIWQKQIVTNNPRRTERLRLIYTGRLTQYQKRILDVVELAAGLDRLQVPYEITLVGEFSPWERTEDIFKLRAKEHLDDGRIKLPGRMTRKQILEGLSRNDFFILLSDFEGLPLSLIEAMARGCVPVVAAMKSGIPEVITTGENGLIVDGRDYDVWARSLVECWCDTERLAQMSERARKTVEERFTVEYVAGEFSRLFAGIAGEVCSGKYKRPDSLNWGRGRSPTGDILPPPSLF